MAKSHTVRHIASMCVAVGYLVISVSHKLKDFAQNFEKSGILNFDLLDIKDFLLPRRNVFGSDARKSI